MLLLLVDAVVAFTNSNHMAVRKVLRFAPRLRGGALFATLLFPVRHDGKEHNACVIVDLRPILEQFLHSDQRKPSVD